jgi:hypothetical protein
MSLRHTSGDVNQECAPLGGTPSREELGREVCWGKPWLGASCLHRSVGNSFTIEDGGGDHSVADGEEGGSEVAGDAGGGDADGGSGCGG